MKFIKEIFNIDKKIFKNLTLYGTLFFLIVFALGYAVTSLYTYLGIATNGLVDAEQISQLAYFALFMQILFPLVLLYIYSFFEHFMWNIIYKKKTTFQSTSKFVVLILSLAAIFTIINGLVFIIISKFPDAILKLGVSLFFFTLLFSFYLMYIGFISFTQHQKIGIAIKQIFSIGIKRLDLTIYPLVISVIVGAVINGGLYLLNWLPGWALYSVQAVTLGMYMAWFRIYLANALKSVKF